MRLAEPVAVAEPIALAEPVALAEPKAVAKAVTIAEPITEPRVRPTGPESTVATPTRSAVLLLAILIVAGVVLRLLWLQDMEFKSDERSNAEFLANLGARPWTAVAPISFHAGISHSSGFYYWIRLLSGGSPDPLTMTSALAVCNALCIAIAAWISRRRTVLLYSCALCATNTTLVVYSRKLWQPDLVAAWVVLGMACLDVAFAPSSRRRAPWLVAAGLSLTASGHMYLGGALAVAVVGAVVWFWLLAERQWRDLRTWTATNIIGLLSFVPYGVALSSAVPGSRGASAAAAHLTLAQISPILVSAATVGSPYSLAALYLWPIMPWMSRYHAGIQLSVCSWFLSASVIVGVAFLWAGIIALWLQRREARRDPLQLAAFALLVANPLALFLVRLGSFTHYWLAIIPWSLYVVAKAFAHYRIGSRALLVWCLVSAMATFAFLSLVHRHDGLPGEYGPAYRAQSNGATKLAR